jgi:hypothetical protein
MTYFKPTPHAFRPKRSLLIAAAALLESDDYIFMTCDQFCARIMSATRGAANLKEVEKLYEELLQEAGVRPDWQFKLTKPETAD